MNQSTTTITTALRPFFRDHPDEPVPEENFWTLWCKGRLTEADTDQPAGHRSIRTKQCPPPTIPHSVMEWLATGKIRPLVVTDYRQLREPGDLQL